MGNHKQSMIMLEKNNYHSNHRGEELMEIITQKRVTVTRGAHISSATLKVSSTVQWYEGRFATYKTYWYAHVKKYSHSFLKPIFPIFNLITTETPIK